MTPKQHKLYLKGEYDPRYPRDFGPLHLGLIYLTFGLLLAFGSFMTLDWWAGLPDVYISHELNHCIEVVNHREGDNYDCDNLPEKYHFHWTE
jgi:hypothetical protein